MVKAAPRGGMNLIGRFYSCEFKVGIWVSVVVDVDRSGAGKTQAMAVNVSSNDTLETSVHLAGSLAARVTKISACCIVLVVALIGNILIILVVHRTTSMRKTVNYFIVNMAVSDLSVPIVILPRVIVEVATDSATWWLVHGIVGDVLCKVVYFLSDLTISVSILSLICISVDRFCAVVFPMKLALITSRVRVWLIAFTWIFSVAFYVPYFYGFKLIESNGEITCSLSWADSASLNAKISYVSAIVGSTLFTLIPFILLTVIYTTILIVTRTKSISTQQQQSQNAKNRRQANNKKLLKLVVLTVGAFACCYGPYNIFLLYSSFVWSWELKAQDVEMFNTFLFVAQFVAYMNSALNPCLYFIFIENYKNGLKRMLTVRKSTSRSDMILNHRTTAKYIKHKSTDLERASPTDIASRVTRDQNTELLMLHEEHTN